MHKYGLKPPRLWYQKKFTTQSDPTYFVQYENLLKDTDVPDFDRYLFNFLKVDIFLAWVQTHLNKILRKKACSNKPKKRLIE